MERKIICEFGPEWERNPPQIFCPRRIEATHQNIGAELQRLRRRFSKAPFRSTTPVVKILYKNVAPENLRETAFVEVLRKIMLKRRVPSEIINSLLKWAGRPETGAFLDR